MQPKSRQKVKNQHEWENLYGIEPTLRDSKLSEGVICSLFELPSIRKGAK